MRRRNTYLMMLPVAVVATSLHAQDVTPDPFSDGPNGAKIHIASGFVCPPVIGHFERDAVGESDVDTGTDFCAYSALDGVYGTIRLTPLNGAYDPQTSLAQGFIEQERTGGRRVDEKLVKVDGVSGGEPLGVFTRTYETAHLEELHYYVEFTGAAVKNWAVEATIEFASPRNDAEAQEFLQAVYTAAEARIAAK